MKKRQPDDLSVDTSPTQAKKVKLGKKKTVYGVNTSKFEGEKASGETAALLSNTSEETD